MRQLLWDFTSQIPFYTRVKNSLGKPSNKIKNLVSKPMARNAFDVQGYLLESKLLVDRALDQYLKPDHKMSLLRQAVCYSVLDGGKRFRPILTLAVGELFGAKRRYPVVVCLRH